MEKEGLNIINQLDLEDIYNNSPLSNIRMHASGTPKDIFHDTPWHKIKFQ